MPAKLRHWCSYAAGGAILMALSAAHLRFRASGFDVRGPLLVLDHLYVIAMVCLLLWLCGAVGSWGRGRWELGLEEPLEQLTFGIAVGAGLIAPGVLLCGLLGHLELTMPVLAGYGLLTWRHVITIPMLVGRSVRQLIASAHPAALVVFSLVVLALIVLALAPPTDWDSLMYHVQIPVRYLEEGRIALLPDNPHVAQVSAPHMLYLPLITLAGWSAPAVFSASIAALFGLSIFGFCHRFLGPGAASMTLAVLWGSPILLLVGATARIDVTLAWLLFLAAYAMVIAVSQRRTQALMLSAFVFGLSIGTKVLAIPFLLALAPVLLWSALRCAESNLRRAVRLSLWFALVALAVASPWLVKNVLLLDAPLAPAFTPERMDPWISELYGGRRLPPEMPALPSNALLDVREKFNLRDFLLEPGRLTPELEGPFYTVNPIVWLSLCVFLIPRWRLVILLLVPALAYPTVLLLAYPYTNLRYLIPSIAFLTIAGTAVAAHVVRTMPGRARLLSFALIGLMCLMPTVNAIAARLRNTGALRLAVGASSRNELLLSSKDLEFRRYYPMTRMVHEVVPPTGRAVLLFESRGLYFSRPVLQDNLYRTWVFLRPLVEAGGCLEGTGVTHILVATDAIEYLVRRGMDLERLEWPEFDRFRRRCLVTVAPQPEGYALYRLRAAAD